MDKTSLEQLREQAALGRTAEAIRSPMAGYLNRIRQAAVLELSGDNVTDERMRILQARLHVTSALAASCLGDISAGKLAEDKLREMEG